MKSPDTTRDRVLELLRKEGRSMHTGEIATRLQVPTHEVQSAMHHPLLRREVDFTSTGGYSLPQEDRRPEASDDAQRRLA